MRAAAGGGGRPSWFFAKSGKKSTGEGRGEKSIKINVN
jgi:hypothetical protein